MLGEWYLAGIGHDNFKYELNRSVGYSFQCIKPEETSTWVWHGSQWYVDYPMKEKSRLDKVLNVEEVAIPGSSDFE